MEQEIPPGQFWGRKFVIYTINGVPQVDLQGYRFELFGSVEKPIVLDLAGIRAMPATKITRDFHCVTKWSIKDCEWSGVPFSDLGARAAIRPEAKFAYAYCLDGYTTVIPIENMSDALLAVALNGEDISPKQGAPVRLVVPSLYGWKSAKWVHAIELLDEYRDGYWEERGYHERGDFMLEERYKDPAARFIHKKVS
jgi:DMSO/TMAO reductase YedYZ molybdopterin-dependent catalytic subunit